MTLLWIVVVLGYALCVAQAIFALTAKRPVAPRIGTGALAIAFGAHTTWLLLKGISTGRCPVAGTQEMCAFLSWSLVIAFIIASRWYHADALKAFIFPIVLVLSTIAAGTPANPIEPLGINSPLQKLLFPVHVGLILLAYAAFFIAFGAGVMYIIQERELRHKRFGTIFYKLPSLDTCDAISYRSLGVGFVMLTMGIAAGIWWQRARDGVFWHGDPMEIFSVVTWLIYLLLLQSRWNRGWSGRTTALASIVSFIIVFFSLVGVRYLGSLHGLG